jgi:hypothetical protein
MTAAACTAILDLQRPVSDNRQEGDAVRETCGDGVLTTAQPVCYFIMVHQVKGNQAVTVMD